MKRYVLALSLLSAFAQASTDTVKTPEVAHHAKKDVEVLKLKGPDTTHGQILSPGQKAGSTTFAESEKYAVPASTAAH